jgi:CBS domain containing-hemolysin-like protein
MRSRVDVVAFDFRMDYKELLEIIKEAGYSRIPVYENDFDNVTGILYVKDLLGHLDEPADFEWQELIRPDVYYVPEAKKINDLLKEFQVQRLHMAIVVDEYGGSSGIVTLEDIMEEVIGEIKDEFDDEIEVVYKKIDDFNYLFEGKTLLNDVCRIIGIDTNTFDEVKGEADSLAGLILEIKGFMPKTDAEITQGPYRFKVVTVSKRRIEQILLTLPKN